MAKKSTKPTRKKSPAKVRDLAARKDPKGGAQKKEGPNLGAPKGGAGVLKPTKGRLA